jgi:hypothetical protein
MVQHFIGDGANGAGLVEAARMQAKRLAVYAVWVGKAGSTADVIFDVTGYFTTGATGLRY